MPCSRPKYAIWSRTFMRGYSPRSSGMYPNRRRSSFDTGRPFQVTRPASSCTRPKTARMAVVLPAPLGPRKPTIRPGGTVRLHLSSAVISP